MAEKTIENNTNQQRKMPSQKNKIVAVDFDGTCVTHEFPRVGRFIGAEKVLKRIVAEGGSLILWTMRSDNRDDGSTPLSDAVEWFNNAGIPLFGIQENPDQNWSTSPKAYAHIYIDDAALGCPLVPGLKGEKPYVNWNAVERILWPEDFENELTIMHCPLCREFRGHGHACENKTT